MVSCVSILPREYFARRALPAQRTRWCTGDARARGYFKGWTITTGRALPRYWPLSRGTRLATPGARARTPDADLSRPIARTRFRADEAFHRRSQFWRFRWMIAVQFATRKHGGLECTISFALAVFVDNRFFGDILYLDEADREMYDIIKRQLFKR